MSAWNGRLIGKLVAAVLAVTPLAASAQAAGAVSADYRWLTFLVFGLIIAATMFVTYLASRRVRSASQFYAAGRSVTGIQNGWAMAVSRIKCNTFSEFGHFLGHHFFRSQPPQRLTRSTVEQPGNVVEVGLAHL